MARDIHKWQRPVGWQQLQALLLLLTAQVLGLHQLNPRPAAAAAAAAAYTSSFIIKFNSNAVQAAQENVAATAAAAEPVAAAAAAAAADRGDTLQGQQRVARMAAAAAAQDTPAVMTLMAAVGTQATTMGMKVSKQTPILTVFQGAVVSVEARSEGDVMRLLRQLRDNPEVSNVWLAVGRKLVKPVESNATQEGSAAAAAAAAAAAKPQAATTGSSVATGLTRLALRHPGINGTGSLICVIDTGINYRLPQYGSCDKINSPKGQCKVVVGYDFVGDNYNGETGSNPVEDDDPLDGPMSHGTMVGSVAATSNGVAPGALLGAYRVFGNVGMSTDAVIIPAIDRAVRDGCNIINLSLASGSGYDERSPYNDVMELAYRQGVLVVKAAGNDGQFGTYFTADVSIAAGAISVGSIGNAAIDVDRSMPVSIFSSFGPHPELKLGPHICAPGSELPVLERSGQFMLESGTSFSSPYIAGVLALWRHYWQQRAAAPAAVADDATADAVEVAERRIGMEAAMRNLVTTAAGIYERSGFLTPVARCGGGVLQADAMLDNQLVAEPMMLLLPSGLRRAYTATIQLTWEGPRFDTNAVNNTVNDTAANGVQGVNDSPGCAKNISVNGSDPTVNCTFPTTGTGNSTGNGTRPKTDRYQVVYAAMHEPAMAMPLTDSWYGTDYASRKRAEAVKVSIFPPRVTIDTNAGAARSATIKVVFEQTPGLLARPPLLYSGVIRLVPISPAARAAGPSLVPIGVPYQGYSAQNYATLRLMARPRRDIDYEASMQLSWNNRALCYAPFSTPPSGGAVMDNEGQVPVICNGGFGAGTNTQLSVTLESLQQSPLCSLRITLAPEVPLSWIYMDLLDANTSKPIGSLDPLDVSTTGSLTKATTVSSWCTNFDGTYKDLNGTRTTVKLGSRYRIRATLEGPMCAADVGVFGREPRREQFIVKGIIRITP